MIGNISNCFQQIRNETRNISATSRNVGLSYIDSENGNIYQVQISGISIIQRLLQQISIALVVRQQMVRIMIDV
jgi:hypothetical protein